jgi:hypothetical protein
MADIADIQTFLAGFDAGEQYALGQGDSCERNNRDVGHIQQRHLKSLESNLS